MLNFRKYAAVTMLAVGLGVVAAEPAPAGDYGPRLCIALLQQLSLPAPLPASLPHL
jgi:hypothetical protein